MDHKDSVFVRRLHGRFRTWCCNSGWFCGNHWLVGVSKLSQQWQCNLDQRAMQLGLASLKNPIRIPKDMGISKNSGTPRMDGL